MWRGTTNSESYAITTSMIKTYKYEEKAVWRMDELEKRWRPSSTW